jgi:hypothetical protein
MALVIFVFLPDAPGSFRGILAEDGVETASSLSLASSGAERFSDPLSGVIASVVKESDRWAELDGMPCPPLAWRTVRTLAASVVDCAFCRGCADVDAVTGEWERGARMLET